MHPDGLRADGIRLVQVNIGRFCNLACTHCHLAASPQRTEMMSWETMESVLGVVDALQPVCVDITGGAPELHGDLRRFIMCLTGKGHAAQVRTNFSALLEPMTDGLIDFFAANHVALVGSMPCYLGENVDAQRGAGAYEKSIEAIGKLNRCGYGVRNELPLVLVHNPGGPFLPPAQAELEEVYRRELGQRFGIHFTQLLTITNMPIGRFSLALEDSGQLSDYTAFLQDAFNHDALAAVMCRHQLCIDWDGRLYDCDFNIALKRGVDESLPQTVEGFRAKLFEKRRIVTGRHCFGCTAGAGSSCAGAIAK